MSTGFARNYISHLYNFGAFTQAGDLNADITVCFLNDAATPATTAKLEASATIWLDSVGGGADSFELFSATAPHASRTITFSAIDWDGKDVDDQHYSFYADTGTADTLVFTAPTTVAAGVDVAIASCITDGTLGQGENNDELVCYFDLAAPPVTNGSADVTVNWPVNGIFALAVDAV